MGRTHCDTRPGTTAGATNPNSPMPGRARASERSRLVLALKTVIAGTLLASGCSGMVSTGACQSDVARTQFHAAVFCYSGWDRGDCDDFQQRRVNGVEWAFHPGQTCAGRGLQEGANPRP